MDNRVVGILGGGQLGRMLVEAGSRLGIKIAILDAPNSPAKQVNATGPHVDGSFGDREKIRELSKNVDVLTYEIEHIDTEVLEELAKEGVDMQPSWKTVRIIQDKYLQKEHLIARGVATAQSVAVEEGDGLEERIRAIGETLGYPFMLKARTLAYDGRGNYVVKNPASIERALDFLGDRPLYAEKFAKFVRELAVMVVRTRDNLVFSYPTVETVHADNICKLVYMPARVADSVQQRAKMLAENAVRTFWGAGVFGVEMFLLENGELLVNEIAPRPHNSLHVSQDACANSQFELHLRAILDLPITQENTMLRTPTTNCIMYNILGSSDPESYIRIAKQALTVAGATVHLYGKTESRSGRKMGHINIVGGSMSEVEYRLSQIMPKEEQFQIFNHGKPNFVPAHAVVGVIMGSDSDLPTMKPAAEILKKFGVPFEVTVVSAHRTPARMVKYAHEASSRGIKVIIAGAGGAAHLPGMTASETHLPVIGVPVRGSTMEGRDSLLSIVQMPRGIPVATVGINNSMNAGLLALRILAVEDSPFGRKIRSDLETYILNMEEEVLKKAEILETQGWEEYVYKK